MKKYIFLITCLSIIFIQSINFKPPPFIEENFSQYQEMLEFNQQYLYKLEQIKSIGANDSLSVIIYDKAVKYGFDPILVTKLIKSESSFNSNAISSKGAIGLMQITKSSCKLYNLEYTFNPEINIDNGLYILNDKVNQYGSLELALYSYNGGHKAVKSKFNRMYVTKIMGGSG